MRKRIAIYGGTFDPVHVGHGLVASSVLRAGLADEVWLMVSPRNPLKQGRELSPEETRLAMARLAAQRMPGLKASDFEFSLPRPSYTAFTLKRLREAYPDCDFRILIGSDNWLLFDHWKEPRQIIADFGVIVYPRPDAPVPEGFRPLRDMPEGWQKKVEFLPGEIPEARISSTYIRQTAAQGKSLAFLVEKEVEEMILREGLYGDNR